MTTANTWPAAVSTLLCLALLAPLVGAESEISGPTDHLPARGSSDSQASAPVESNPLEGKKIVRIVFIRRDVFDTTAEETSSWPYRWANALHMVSTEDFLRSMLLFTEGDAFSEHSAAESARILRGLDFINPVEITAREVEGGVEVTVDTHDQWTLEIGAKFGLFGNRSAYAFSFDEESLLGRGWHLKVKYKSNDERQSWTYGLYDPNILGTRWRARLEHEEATDGDSDHWLVDYPFYSLATPRSWGIEWQDRIFHDHLYSAGEQAVSGMTSSDSLRVWGGIRLPGELRTTRRIIAGYDYQKRTYEDWTWKNDGSHFAEPDPITISGPRIGYQQIADRYLVLRGFRSWRAQEDVALGPNFDFGVTFSLPGLGADQVRTLIDGRVSAARRHDNWMLLGDVWTSGRIEDDQYRDAIFGFQVAASQLGQRGWQARLRVDFSHELDRDRQLTLGADTGLRGWNPDYFDGTGRAVLNIQYRTMLWEDVLHLFSLGFIAFGDVGHTWDPRVGSDTGRVHGDIGIGLVADVTEVGLVKLLRLEAALPDDGTGVIFTVTTTHLF